MGTMDFNRQLTSLQDNLTYFAKSLTRDEEEAKDLVQDTFLKAITYREKFEENTNLKAWTYTIMKNTFINNYRKNSKVNMVMDNSADLYYLNSSRSPDDANPESALSHKDISKVVDNLEDDHRIPFQMHHTGYKYKEIAEHLDLSIGTVKSRIFFSRKKLMSSLKDYK
jgi:RNA polymerase sigma-70 factor (ECF subfamily)